MRLFDLVQTDMWPLPFLPRAIKRFHQQFPSAEYGLSLTESMILERLEQGPASLKELYLDYHGRESMPFMGDSVIFRHAEGLTHGPCPLARRTDGRQFVGALYHASRVELEITQAGCAVLSGQADAIHLNGIDRWFGGVHLQGNEAEWRWSTEKQVLVRVNIP
jgi:hypothetical protein